MCIQIKSVILVTYHQSTKKWLFDPRLRNGILSVFEFNPIGLLYSVLGPLQTGARLAENHIFDNT